MKDIVVLRSFLLGLAVLAVLTGTLLDGVAMKYIMRPIVRRMEEASGGAQHFPPGLSFMMTHAWARRVYHLAFAGIVLAAWWYLGTPAGAAFLHPH